MKKITFGLLYMVVLSMNALGQYYNGALGLSGPQLKTSLHNIIQNHNALSYDDLWNAFTSTDVKPNGKVWDMYTDVPSGTPTYTFQFGINQCGNYNSEGDCYNREHSWPKEYFGGDDAYPMYSDLHHIFATDGWVNNRHASYPLGKVINLTGNASSNGTKLGTGSSYAGYGDKLFEPIDAYKGDFARAYFYMSVRYENEDGSWTNWPMANGAELTNAAVVLLLGWHNADPVDQKEIDRNNAVYALQNNRNPFVDYPQFANCIWGGQSCTSLSSNDFQTEIVEAFPNPCHDYLQLTPNKKYDKIILTDLVGKSFIVSTNTQNQIDISHLANGIYLLRVQNNNIFYHQKFLKY